MRAWGRGKLGRAPKQSPVGGVDRDLDAHVVQGAVKLAAHRLGIAVLTGHQLG
jgi:hypothetical protein